LGRTVNLHFLVILAFLLLSSQLFVAEASCKHRFKRFYHFKELAWGDENSWSDIDGDWIQDQEEKLSPCVLVAISFFKGRVIAVGDEGFLSNVLIDEADNLKLGTNIINWLAQACGNNYRVLFDASHNELEDIDSNDPWLGYSKFAERLRGLGYTVEKNTRKIAWSTLRNYDVLVINAPNRSFLPSEIVAIVHFVLNGGGLFLMGEWHMSEHQHVSQTLNPLAAFFGIKFNEDTVCDLDDYWIEGPQYPIICVFADHPVLKGVNEIYYYLGCSIENDEVKGSPESGSSNLQKCPG